MLRYLLLDVFTERPYGGNPLAVVPFPEQELDTATMQAIAAEFNLSETVFLYPPKSQHASAEARIFTPAQELPFAGHPTIGAAIALGLMDRLHPGEKGMLDEGVGAVPIELLTLDGGYGRARLTAARLPEMGPLPPAPQVLAALLGLTQDQLDDEVEAAAYSCGVPFLFIPLKTIEAVDRAQLHGLLWREHLASWWAPSVFVFSRQTKDPQHHIYGRMFGPEKGIVEDPATGSAAAAMAGYLDRFYGDRENKQSWIIEQGYAMGRPSLLEVSVTREERCLSRVEVSGSAVWMGEGWLRHLPQNS